jgi:DNA-binding NtrC family response regulator
MEPTARKSKPIHVLLVEDEFLISAWVAHVLSDQGFRVRTAANAADALRHLVSDRVDVLLTDIRLSGGMDGAALARRARQLRPTLPVVYASAQAGMPGSDALVPGAVFVAKPYEPTLLGPLLRTALGSTTADLHA